MMHTMYMREVIAFTAPLYTMPTAMMDGQPLSFPTPGKRQVITRKKRQGKRK